MILAAEGRTTSSANRLLSQDRSSLIAGAVGILTVLLAPTPIWTIGIALYAGSVVLTPWTATPLIILTLPFYLHPRTIAGQELSATEVAILVSVVAVATRGLFERMSLGATGIRDGDHASPHPNPLPEGEGVGRRSVRIPRPGAVAWIAAAFMGAALLSLLASEYPKQSLRELRWLIVEPILVFYLARSTLISVQQVAAVLWAIVGAGFLAAVTAIASLAGQGSLLQFSTRATAPYLSPNHLGLFLTRASATAVAMLLWPLTGSRAKGLWAALACMGLAILRSLSVGAWAGLLSAILVVAATKSRRALGFSILALIAAAALAFVLVPSGRILGRLDPASGTAFFRIEIWQAALHMIADHPIFGLGLDNFLYAYQGGYMLPEAWREPNISHPHNWVLDFWIQMGLFGLAAAAALVLWTVRIAISLVRAGPNSVDRALGATALGITVSFLVHGSVDNGYFLVDLATLWWIVVALLVIRYPDAPTGPASMAPAPIVNQDLRPPGRVGESLH